MFSLWISFHIGSQILNLETFHVLCERINQLQDDLSKRNIQVKHINVGGGLGVDYENPDKNPIPDFGRYFDIFQHNLNLRGGQQLHFELGRSIVCQCGSLITRVLYVKKGIEKQFVIVDAGMTDLIRPALYQAHHLSRILLRIWRSVDMMSLDLFVNLRIVSGEM